jgi:hypothetical protein
VWHDPQLVPKELVWDAGFAVVWQAAQVVDVPLYTPPT